MRIIVSGGGTGGHLYPALALGRAFREAGAEVLYVGSTYGLEKEAMAKEDFPYRLLPVAGIHKKVGLSLLQSIWRVHRSYLLAKNIVAEFRPDLVVGTGGYAAYPTLRAAAAAGAKTLIHEANAELGLANRKLAPLVDCLCLHYSDTAHAVKNAKRIEVVGMPIRQSVKDATREEGGTYLRLKEDRLLVTVTGGSQGSQHINAAMAEIYKRYGHRDDLFFYHIVGRNNLQETQAYKSYAHVRCVGYEERMDLVLARSDLCIGRAGASFLAEIAVKGIPAILVPYPFSGGHQERNAAHFADQGAALMVLDRELPGGLMEKFEQMVERPQCRAAMAEKIKRRPKPMPWNGFSRSV